MKHFFLVLIFTFMVFGQNAEAKYKQLNKSQIKALMPVEKRIIFSLAGKWQMSEDNGINWKTVYMPNSFVSNKVLTLKKNIKIDNELIKSKSWHLNFLGAKSQVEFYINDILIGKHYSNSTPFKMNIPDRVLRKDRNILKIVVYPPQDDEKLINTKKYFPPKSRIGLFREMYLVGTSNIWIDNVRPKVSFNENLSVCYLNTKIRFTSGKVTDNMGTILEISDSTGRKRKITSNGVYAILKVIDKTSGDTVSRIRTKEVAISSERTEEIELNFSLNSPKLWSIDNPNIYEFQTDLFNGNFKIDSYSFDYGLYKFSNNGNKFYLNNRKMKIKGMTYYEDFYGDNYTVSPKRLLKDLKQFKLAGANAVFIKAFSPNPLFLHYCDSLGILAFCELPVNNVPKGIIARNSMNVYIKNITSLMLEAYSNYSSLVAWGISDASGESNNEFSRFQSNISELIKKNSNGLVFKTILLNSEIVNKKGIDFIVVSTNRTQTNFYELNQSVKAFKQLNSGTPLVFQYGSICNPVNHNGYSDPLSIFFQAYNISNCYRISEQNRLAGNFINSFNDYPLDNPLLITDYSNRETATFGVNNRARKLRISFNTVQSLFTDETEPLLDAGSFVYKSPLSFLLMTIILVGVLFVMMNQMSRFREQFIRALIRPFNFYADIRDQRVMSSFQTITLSLILSLTLSIFLVSIIYINRTSEITQFILSLLIPSSLLKSLVFTVLWQPLLSVLLLTISFLIMILIASILIRLIAFIIHSRVYFGDCFTISVWASLPIVLLLPFNLFITKIVVSAPTTIPFFVLSVLLMFIWILFRIFRSCSVVFNIPKIKTYLVGLLIVLFLIVGPLTLYIYNNSLFSYLQYLFSVLLK